jgi:hypothetical protein
MTPFRYRPTGFTRDIFTVTGVVALRPGVGGEGSRSSRTPVRQIQSAYRVHAVGSPRDRGRGRRAASSPLRQLPPYRSPRRHHLIGIAPSHLHPSRINISILHTSHPSASGSALCRYGRVVQSSDPPLWSTTLDLWVKTIDSRGGPGGPHRSAASVALATGIDSGRESSFIATDNTRRFGIAAPSAMSRF